MVSIRNFTRAGLAAGVLGLLLALSGGVSASPGTPAPQPASAEYAGEDTCLTCHEDQAYKPTAHGRAFNERTPAATQGCESCHGPGKAHAEAGGDRALIRSYQSPGAVRGERDVHLVSRPRLARAVGR